MHMAYELCLATAGKQVPSGPDWIHEVKHDGYRMLVIREDKHRDRPYRSGRQKHWVKVKNWSHPAMGREL